LFKFVFPWLINFGSSSETVIPSNEPVVLSTEPVVSNPLPISVEQASVGGSQVKEINMNSKLANSLGKDFSFRLYRMAKIGQAISLKGVDPVGYESQFVILLNKFLPQPFWQSIID